eukprot:CAMPEP_0177411522 /NCGR_PEP_ID=MMETSP0368-20130122/65465_1 /TAXON_ID=447022 ORGANISM="Scrippsiella hangoei-like, Strain SHHI-4" /NCGR_SAMPLE_ID=MMETSP0368 /ASSEMBLY_ACC=CAM_ASM_000363 /LENGTH=209 /DNA_ID=CAMNT_0018880649 /DNA_START=88 /DNA_END=719 /DNA_ORIENTATION=+
MVSGIIGEALHGSKLLRAVNPTGQGRPNSRVSGSIGEGLQRSKLVARSTQVHEQGGDQDAEAQQTCDRALGRAIQLSFVNFFLGDGGGFGLCRLRLRTRRGGVVRRWYHDGDEVSGAPLSLLALRDDGHAQLFSKGFTLQSKSWHLGLHAWDKLVQASSLCKVFITLAQVPVWASKDWLASAIGKRVTTDAQVAIADAIAQITETAHEC